MWILAESGGWYNLERASSIECADQKSVTAMIDGKSVVLKTLKPGESVKEVLNKVGAAQADESGYFDAAELKVMTPYRSPKH